MSSQLIALFVVIALLFCLVCFLFGKGYPKLHTQKTRYRRNHSRRTVIEQGETQRNFEAAETEDELKQHRKDL